MQHWKLEICDESMLRGFKLSALINIYKKILRRTHIVRISLAASYIRAVVLLAAPLHPSFPVLGALPVPAAADSACTPFHIYFRHSFSGFPLGTSWNTRELHIPIALVCMSSRTLLDTLREIEDIRVFGISRETWPLTFVNNARMDKWIIPSN